MKNTEELIDKWQTAVIAYRDKKKQLNKIDIEISSVRARLQWLMFGDNEGQVKKAQDKVRQLLKHKEELENQLADLKADADIREAPAREAWALIVAKCGLR